VVRTLTDDLLRLYCISSFVVVLVLLCSFKKDLRRSPAFYLNCSIIANKIIVNHNERRLEADS